MRDVWTSRVIVQQGQKKKQHFQQNISGKCVCIRDLASFLAKCSIIINFICKKKKPLS